LLHAYSIYFVHPTTKERLSFVADFDNVMKEYLENKFDMESLNDVMDSEFISNSFSL